MNGFFEVVTIIRAGTRVRFVNTACAASATVLSAGIFAGGQINYEVSWFADGERKTAWVNSFEVEPFKAGD